MKGHARLLTITMLLVACGTGEPPGGTSDSSVMVRDSAGVRLVEHSNGFGAIPTEAVPAPVMAYGHDDADYPFDQIIDGAILPDGSVAIADVGSSEVIRINSAGEGHVVLARSGQGPGEVRIPMSVHSIGGDSLLVEDDGNGKFIVFDNEELKDVFSLNGTEMPAFGLRGLAVDASGNLLMHTSSYMPDQDEGWISGYLVVVDPVAMAFDTAASYEMAISSTREAPRNPFAPYGQVSGSRNGFVQGRTDRGELLWLDLEGRPVQRVRWNPERRIPTQDDLDEFVGRLRIDMARVNPNMSADRLERFIQGEIERLELDPTQPMPLYLQLSDFGDAGVWLTDFTPTAMDMSGADAVTFLSRDGTSMRRLVFPTPVRILDVAHGFVLGVRLDEFDVPGIVLYPHVLMRD